MTYSIALSASTGLSLVLLSVLVKERFNVHYTAYGKVHGSSIVPLVMG